MRLPPLCWPPGSVKLQLLGPPLLPVYNGGGCVTRERRGAGAASRSPGLAPVCLQEHRPTLAVTDAASSRPGPSAPPHPDPGGGIILVFILMREPALNPAAVPALPQGQCTAEQVPTGSRAPPARHSLDSETDSLPGLAPVDGSCTEPVSAQQRQ